MPSRPLEYESLKAVLLRMDANTRFRISLHMPSIRNVERMLPLKIHHLNLNDSSTKINDTFYAVRIVRHYPDGEAHRRAKAGNSLGWSHSDFDEFGFPFNVVLPGDITFVDKYWLERRFDSEEDEARHRTGLSVNEKALERLTELKSKGITVENYLRSLESLPDNELLQENIRIREVVKYDSEKMLSRSIEFYQHQLLPFDCRKNNTKAPYKCFIQLTIRKGRNTQAKLLEYNKKRFEAVKYLHEVLFGSRTPPIQVEDLDLTSMSSMHGIFRVPDGFRLQAIKVHLVRDVMIHRNLPLLVENSDSLDTVYVNHFLEPHHLQSQAVRNAKRVVIGRSRPSRLGILLQVISLLPNPEISILPRDMTFTPEHYFQMIRVWSSGERQVGASLWIKLGDDPTAREILRLVQIRSERTKMTERCVTIHRNDSTKVEAFYVPFKAIKRCEWRCKWIMKIRVVKA